MSQAQIFRFSQAKFQFGDAPPLTVDLAQENPRKTKHTHFTLILGANGTCKSRILSSCINLLNSAHRKRDPEPTSEPKRTVRTDEPDRDMRCESALLVRNGSQGLIDENDSDESLSLLPARVLAIANLVRDRFLFSQWDQLKEPFYFYLGVRQASNLTTTGAMDRLVSDATIELLADDRKYTAFSEWVSALFPQNHLALVFPRFAAREIERFAANPAEWLRRRVGKNRGPAAYDRALSAALAHAKDIALLGELLHMHAVSSDGPGLHRMVNQGTKILNLSEISPATRMAFGQLRSALSVACSFGLIARPSLRIGRNVWLDFTQLSSGEQNIIATAARLFAFALPGSFIVIDEPEVSLNVAWQQRYIELVSSALQFAEGSHVVIASHSPYLVADLRADNSTIVVIERSNNGLRVRSTPGEFWGWGSEAILYEVLGLPSASNYLFSQELANALKLVAKKSDDVSALKVFLRRCEQLEFGSGSEPLKNVIEEIRAYTLGFDK